MTSQYRFRQAMLTVVICCFPSIIVFAQKKPVKRSSVDIKSTNLNCIATSTKWNDQIAPQNYNEFLNYPINLPAESLDKAVPQLADYLKKRVDDNEYALLPQTTMHHLIKPIYLMSDSSIVFHVIDHDAAKRLLEGIVFIGDRNSGRTSAIIQDLYVEFGSPQGFSFGDKGAFINLEARIHLVGSCHYGNTEHSLGVILPTIFNSENAQKQILISMLMTDAKQQANDAALFGNKVKSLRKEVDGDYASRLGQLKLGGNPSVSMFIDIENDNFKNEAMLVYSLGNMFIGLEKDINQGKLSKISPVIKCSKLLLSTFKQNISSMNAAKTKILNTDAETRRSVLELMEVRSRYYNNTISILNKANEELGDLSTIHQRLNVSIQ